MPENPSSPISSSTATAPSTHVQRVALAGHVTDPSVVRHRHLLARRGGSLRWGGYDRTRRLAEADPRRRRHLRTSRAASPCRRRRGTSGCVPSGRVSGSAPRHVSSIRLPRSPGVGPLTVPDANRSPAPVRGAVDGEVGELLGEGPVHATRSSVARDLAAVELDARGARSSPHGSAARRYGLGARVLLGRLDQERAQRVERDDPRRDRRGEALGEVRSERLVLEGLDVAGRPVVEQHDAEHVPVGVVGARCASTCGPPTRKPTSSSKSSARVGARRGRAVAGSGTRPSGRTIGGAADHDRAAPGRGSRRGGDASWAAAARRPGAGSARGSWRGGSTSRSRRSRRPRPAAARRRRRSGAAGRSARAR